MKRRFMLVFELVLLKLELDLRRPPRSGPEGGRPVERFNSLRKDRPQDWAVKLYRQYAIKVGAGGSVRTWKHTDRQRLTAEVTHREKLGPILFTNLR